jgi:FMN phosphatase YigB (HAD superfamily)
MANEPGRPAVGAVTFDYWNTLVHASDRTGQWRVDAWSGLLAASGHDVDAAAVRLACETAWRAHHAAWTSNVPTDGPTLAMLAVDALGFDVSPALRSDLVDALCGDGGPERTALCPGVAAVVEELAARGLHLGIVCDVGLTPSHRLRAILDRHGLLGMFAGWSFSDEVGTFKPDPRIFEHALGYLGCTPASTVHVGDIRRTDVGGAAAMGMTSVRYRGVSDDADALPDADHVIDHHVELLGIIDLMS